ncbi:hypothetical protein L4D76_19730 [Photobacterium sagamiensis]|uniref:YtfJ family protein n=1 Tax=Photobacterium sagamiensis TaxID=2910241 RepID=UPI003D0F51E4
MTNLVIGAKLPSIEVAKEGQISEKNKYVPWSSSEVVGEPKVLIVMAGHPESGDKVADLLAKLDAEKPEARVVKIVNTKEAPMGAGMFIKSEFKKAYKANPANTLVLDKNATAKEALAIADLSALVAVLNADGEAVFVHEGHCGAAEIDAVLAAL